MHFRDERANAELQFLFIDFFKECYSPRSLVPTGISRGILKHWLEVQGDKFLPEHWNLLTQHFAEIFKTTGTTEDIECIVQLERITALQKFSHASYYANQRLGDCLRTYDYSRPQLLKAIELYETANKLAAELKIETAPTQPDSDIYVKLGYLYYLETALHPEPKNFSPYLQDALQYYHQAILKANTGDEVIEVTDKLRKIKLSITPDSPHNDFVNRIAELIREKLNNEGWVERFPKHAEQLFSLIQTHIPHPRPNIYFEPYFKHQMTAGFKNAIGEPDPIASLLKFYDEYSRRSDRREDCMVLLASKIEKFIKDNLMSRFELIRSKLFSFNSSNRDVGLLQVKLIDFIDKDLRLDEKSIPEEKSLPLARLRVDFYHTRLTRNTTTVNSSSSADKNKILEQYRRAIEHRYRSTPLTEPVDLTIFDEKLIPREKKKEILQGLARVNCVPAIRHLIQYYDQRKMDRVLYLQAKIALLTPVGTPLHNEALAHIRQEKKYRQEADFYLQVIREANTLSRDNLNPDEHMLDNATEKMAKYLVKIAKEATKQKKISESYSAAGASAPGLFNRRGEKLLTVSVPSDSPSQPSPPPSPH